jgi:hypothetical protein
MTDLLHEERLASDTDDNNHRQNRANVHPRRNLREPTDRQASRSRGCLPQQASIGNKREMFNQLSSPKVTCAGRRRPSIALRTRNVLLAVGG